MASHTHFLIDVTVRRWNVTGDAVPKLQDDVGRVDPGPGVLANDKALAVGAGRNPEHTGVHRVWRTGDTSPDGEVFLSVAVEISDEWPIGRQPMGGPDQIGIVAGTACSQACEVAAVAVLDQPRECSADNPHYGAVRCGARAPIPGNDEVRVIGKNEVLDKTSGRSIEDRPFGTAGRGGGGLLKCEIGDAVTGVVETALGKDRVDGAGDGGEAAGDESPLRRR